ncbi:MAG TPA: hypothetical protein VF590_04795, partial [Isosphaeraceae bacterium]
LYEAGCLATLLLAAGLNGARRRRLRRVVPGEVESFEAFCAGLQILMALLATASYAAALMVGRSLITDGGALAEGAVLLIGPGAAALLATGLGIWFGPGPLAAVLSGLGGGDGRPPLRDGPDGGGPRRSLRKSLGDGLLAGATALLIVALIYVPSWRQLAGQFLNDGFPFHHWDFFVMGPALGYLHGGSLGTEVFSQYGVGWPLFFAWLSPAVPLSYGIAVHVATIYGCIYLMGLYLALRLALGSGAWALAGVLLAIDLQMFMGVFPSVTLWMYPSASVLRSPMDVWFFLAMLLHLRSGKLRWAALIGALTGLAVLFGTDTGLYLLATLLLYLACLLSPAARRAAPVWREGLLATPAVTLSTMAMTVLVGFAVASRGTLVRADFWAGWMEAPRVYIAGLSALPMATAPNTKALILFAIMVSTYLVFLGLLVVAVLDGRAEGELIAGGCLGAYGLGALLLFVNRSHTFNIFHVCIPFCALAIAAAAWARRQIAGRAAWWAEVARPMPLAVVGMALVLLANNPNVRDYPNPLSEFLEGPRPAGLCLMRDVCGLSPRRQGFIDQFAAVVRTLAALKARGATVGVLDKADTMFYLASGCPPPDRYCPLVINMFREDQLERTVARFFDKKIDYLVVSNEDPASRAWADVWNRFRSGVERHYVPVDQIGSYGVWRRREGEVAGPADPSGWSGAGRGTGG